VTEKLSDIYTVVHKAVHAAITAMTPAERERLVMGPYDEVNGRGK
jgi:Xaa-Pro aminopeptidase